MKKIVAVLVCILLIVSLCGCSNAITEGEVYEKEYREEYTTVMMLPLVISNGKTTTTKMIPYFVHYPDRYDTLFRTLSRQICYFYKNV